MVKRTREQIIRAILRRESAGLPLTHGGDQGVDEALYRAGLRIFGSWPNAVMAAGIAPDRAQVQVRWSPGKVVSAIRTLSRRRRRPMQPSDLRRRYSDLVHAARRFFGSWPKALIAARVDPVKLGCAVPWTKERIIEAILTRALNNEALDIRTVRPKALVAASGKIFGTWGAALIAAGLDPRRYLGRKPTSCQTESGDIAVDDSQRGFQGPGEMQGGDTAASPKKPSVLGNVVSRPLRKTGDRWSDQAVLQAIQARHCEHRMMHGTAVYKDDLALYQVARRRHGSWSNALLAAGMNPVEIRRYRTQSESKCQKRSSDQHLVQVSTTLANETGV
jgi:hypothetical protein